MDVTETFCAGDALTLQTRFIKIAAMQTDLGAQVAHGLHLRFVYVFSGRINDHARAEEPATVSDRLAVVAGGGGNESWPIMGVGSVIDPVATAPGTDTGPPASTTPRGLPARGPRSAGGSDKVNAAAHFERAGGLQVL